MRNLLLAISAASTAMIAAPAYADTIDPASFTADLEVGESVTIRKTVIIEEGSPTDATIDAYFLIDTTGSMGGAIANAKSASTDIFNAIAAAFGSDLAGGVGAYGENAGLIGDACTFIAAGGSICTTAGDLIAAPGAVINQDVTTTQADVISAIDDITLRDPDFGGDGPESANTAIELVAENASWRAGSNRFLFVLSDAASKGSPDADVIAALAAEGITLVTLDFGSGAFTADMGDLGAITFSGGSTPQDIVDAVTAGIVAGFGEYSEVTVSDLGAGLPEIDVSTVCVSADTGACVGSDAIGMYDRSEDRTFEFDVTFTRVVAGDTSFDTYGLVDGGIVATEADRFPDGEIPLPGAAWFMISGIAGLVWRRKQKAAAA